MSWRVVVRPEVEADLSEAAAWYDSKEDGLGTRFVEEVLRVFDELATNPLLTAGGILPKMCVGSTRTISHTG